HVDVAPRLLRLEVRRGGARDVERAVQVHVDDRAPLLDRHVEEEAVAQDAGVVYYRIDLSKSAYAKVDDALRRLPFRHAVGTGDRLAAGRLDLVDDLLRRTGIAAFARHRGAHVV